jgi:tRNA(fMet)-specific endonuclease VapC
LPYVSLPFDNAAARHYAEIRGGLEESGTAIGSNDLLIASIARSNGLIVASGNIAEFGRVPGLITEDRTREMD